MGDDLGLDEPDVFDGAVLGALCGALVGGVDDEAGVAGQQDLAFAGGLGQGADVEAGVSLGDADHEVGVAVGGGAGTDAGRGEAVVGVDGADQVPDGVGVESAAGVVGLGHASDVVPLHAAVDDEGSGQGGLGDGLVQVVDEGQEVVVSVGADVAVT